MQLATEVNKKMVNTVAAEVSVCSRIIKVLRLF